MHDTPKSLMGNAVSYTLGQWDRLLFYLERPEVGPDNNSAENAIRPFAVGQKNWLFACAPDGAFAGACLYSLIESAKANRLEPYRYLRYLFEKGPFAQNEDDYNALLPMNLTDADLVLPHPDSGVL